MPEWAEWVDGMGLYHDRFLTVGDLMSRADLFAMSHPGVPHPWRRLGRFYDWIKIGKGNNRLTKYLKEHRVDTSVTALKETGVLAKKWDKFDWRKTITARWSYDLEGAIAHVLKGDDDEI